MHITWLSLLTLITLSWYVLELRLDFSYLTIKVPVDIMGAWLSNALQLLVIDEWVAAPLSTVVAVTVSKMAAQQSDGLGK